MTAHHLRVVEAVITSVEAINTMVTDEHLERPSDERICEALVAIVKELTWLIVQDEEYKPHWARPEGEVA